MSIIKRPTLKEFLEYDGAHCKSLWKKTDDTWQCPACNRNKFEIMRWTTRFPKSPNPFKGWIAILNRHHDHSQGYVDYGKGRFAAVILCGQCNASDGRAKKMLNLPKYFSFSPFELTQFITSIPHGAHKLNLDIAGRIYQSLELSGQVRSDLYLSFLELIQGKFI